MASRPPPPEGEWSDAAPTVLKRDPAVLKVRQLEEVPRASSVPDHPPELIVNAGTWTLRWKA